MIGSLLAGTDESPGEVFLYQGRSYKSYRGMGSLGAMAQGSADRYFQQDVKEQVKLVPEGVEGQVPYRGPVGGDRAPARRGPTRRHGLCRGGDDPRFPTQGALHPHHQRGPWESHVHDMAITRESPNYHRGCERARVPPGQLWFSSWVLASSALRRRGGDHGGGGRRRGASGKAGKNGAGRKDAKALGVSAFFPIRADARAVGESLKSAPFDQVGSAASPSLNWPSSSSARLISASEGLHGEGRKPIVPVPSPRERSADGRGSHRAQSRNRPRRRWRAGGPLRPLRSPR